MRTFKQYLTEALKPRSTERAKKLLDRLASKHDAYNEIPFKKHRYAGGLQPNLPGEKHLFHDLGVQDMDIKKLHPGQEHFSHYGVTQKLDHEDDRPVIAIRHAAGDVRIQDGHHRYMAKRLKRSATIKAHVFAPTLQNPQHPRNKPK